MPTLTSSDSGEVEQLANSMHETTLEISGATSTATATTNRR